MIAQSVETLLDPRTFAGAHPLTALLGLGASLACGIVIATVYRWTHRGLSYSQTFQFSLVLLAMLGTGIMLVASTGIIPAIGIIGGFSLIRFRTPVKDPKDMAYILFSLVVGLAMGIQLYWIALIVTGVICATIVVLTRANFGLGSSTEAVIRVTVVGAEGTVDVQALESMLEQTAAGSHLLSAVGQGERMELTYGIRPRRGQRVIEVLEQARRLPGVAHAELFDAKHQVEF